MEGPTPRPLIHAATMVAAGVFLIAGCTQSLKGVPAAMNVIAFTGAFTAFLGATIAITQNDIKRVWLTPRFPNWAMVMAMGVGAYSAGLFHLMTRLL